MKKISFVFAVVLLFSCNSEPKKTTVEKIEITPAGNFYKQSEMAALMLLMYEKNAENKKLILEGKEPKIFPEEFLKIHTATLTDPTDRTADFETFSTFYLSNLKKVFEPSDLSLKERHNITINSCIACHQTTCVGPIPKIKKLLIP